MISHVAHKLLPIFAAAGWFIMGYILSMALQPQPDVVIEVVPYAIPIPGPERIVEVEKIIEVPVVRVVEVPARPPSRSQVLAIPRGLSIVTSPDGCWLGYCDYVGRYDIRAFYDSPTRTIVKMPWFSSLSAQTQAFVIRHETCHAHQHVTILRELGSEPEADLEVWRQTTEGRAWGGSLEAYADWCANQGFSFVEE